MESRTQGSRPKPRTQTKFEAKAKNSSSENRPSRGQGQECLRPRLKTKNTGGKCFTKKKFFKNFSGDLKKTTTKSSFIFFSRSPEKTVFKKIVQVVYKFLSFPKILLSSTTIFDDLKASMPRPRTSKCFLKDVLEAKDVLKESTSAKHKNKHKMQ